MKDQLRPFYVPKELMPKACTRRGTLDQAGYICHDKGTKIAHVDNTEVRFKRCKRIIGNLRLGGGDNADKCGLASIWKTNQTDIGYKLELELKFFFVARPPGIVVSRCTPC